jgi:hypothetical protein
MSLQVGDLFVCEANIMNIKFLILEIRGDKYKVHYYSKEKSYDFVYNDSEINIILNNRGWKHYPVVK